MKNLKFFLLLTGFFILSCQNEREIVSQEPTQPERIVSQSAEIKSFTLEDLKNIEQKLKKNGYDTKGFSTSNLDLKTGDYSHVSATARYNNDGINQGLFLNAIKVNYMTPHPDGSGRMINCSGVILVPPSKWRSYRVVVSLPTTYLWNNAAPSKFFENFIYNPFTELDGAPLLVAALRAASGFATFIPDYQGFGDSNGVAFHPYIVKEAMNRSNIDFYKAAESRIKSLGYSLKKGILIEGYSQAAFTAAQMARELETNESKYNIQVLALACGGTPARLEKLVTTIKSAKRHPFPFFFPDAYLGFYENKKINLPLNRIFQEPYATTARQYFLGNSNFLQILSAFPQEINKFLTKEFIESDFQNPNNYYYPMYKLMVENSLDPWKNKCEFRMYHGVSDDAVYFEQAKQYAQMHNNAGGSVKFIPTIGEHLVAFVPFYLALVPWFEQYKY